MYVTLNPTSNNVVITTQFMHDKQMDKNKLFETSADKYHNPSDEIYRKVSRQILTTLHKTNLILHIHVPLKCLMRRIVRVPLKKFVNNYT